MFVSIVLAGSPERYWSSRNSLTIPCNRSLTVESAENLGGLIWFRFNSVAPTVCTLRIWTTICFYAKLAPMPAHGPIKRQRRRRRYSCCTFSCHYKLDSPNSNDATTYLSSKLFVLLQVCCVNLIHDILKPWPNQPLILIVKRRFLQRS